MSLTFKEWLSFSLLGIIVSLVLFAVISPISFMLIFIVIVFLIVAIILCLLIFILLYFTHQLPDDIIAVYVVRDKEFYSGIIQSLGINGIVVLLLLIITVIKQSHDHYTLILLLTIAQYAYWIPIIFIRIIKHEIKAFQGIVIGTLVTIPILVILFMILFYIDSLNFPIYF